MPEIGRIVSLDRPTNDIEDEEEEVEEEILEQGNDRIDLSENYQFARVILLMKLKKDIVEERKNKTNRSGAGYSILSFFGVGAAQPAELQQMNAVDDYWSGNNVSNSPSTTHATVQPNMIFDVKILQMVFRVWIELKKMRAVRKIANKNSEKTIMIQSAVRRWLTRKHFVHLESEKLAKDRAFRDFCVEMKKGIQIDMFSKKKGMVLKRVVRIVDACLVYQTSAWHYTKHPCNTIYAVNKGLSPHKYGTEFQGQKSLCFHLLLIGDIVLDFCARDALQTKVLMDGFTYLRMLLFTQAPFYIDEQGFPRRANESIINRALEIAEGRANQEEPTTRSYSMSIAAAFSRSRDAGDEEQREGAGETDPLKAAAGVPVKLVKGSISEADDMRLMTAKSLLETEYKAWNESYRKEKEEWMEEMRSRMHRKGGSHRRKKGTDSSSLNTDSKPSGSEDKKSRPRSLTATFAGMFKRKKKDSGKKSDADGSSAQHRGSLSSGDTHTIASADPSLSTTLTPPPPAGPSVTFAAHHHPPAAPHHHHPVAKIPAPAVKTSGRASSPAASSHAADVAAVHSTLARPLAAAAVARKQKQQEESDEEEEEDESESEGSGSSSGSGSCSCSDPDHDGMSDEYDEEEDESDSDEGEDV